MYINPIPSQACFDLIKEFEGCVLEAYPDPATGGEPWTIGFGHTGLMFMDGCPVAEGLIITQPEANRQLEIDVEAVAVEVGHAVTAPLTQPQLDALVSFTFNEGIGQLRSSTLLRLLNNGEFSTAADQFSAWVYGAGKVMPGLARRRAAERALFLSPPSAAPTTDAS